MTGDGLRDRSWHVAADIKATTSGDKRQSRRRVYVFHWCLAPVCHVGPQMTTSLAHICALGADHVSPAYLCAPLCGQRNRAWRVCDATARSYVCSARVRSRALGIFASFGPVRDRD
jgi:hypothetical protein